MTRHTFARLFVLAVLLGAELGPLTAGVHASPIGGPTVSAGASPTALQISGGYFHTCLLNTEGGVQCWGTNFFGELGNGGYGQSFTPVDVVGLSSGVQAIGVGAQSSCALTQRGGVKCWGWNAYGEVGDGTLTIRKTPVDVVGLSSGVQAIAVGEFFACALTDAGGVKCWGRNINRGALGDGTVADRYVPGDVVGLTQGVRAIAAASGHACALLWDDTMQCWGANQHGEIGDGTTELRTAPTKVLGLSGPVQKMALGSVHTCALLVSGSLQCWGGNANGQLGDGTLEERHTPTLVDGLPLPAHAVTATWTGSTCVLVGAGTPLCWGLNNHGQLGDGTIQNRLTPTAVRGLPHDLLALDLGPGLQACAVTLSGGALCWGHNGYGALGDGTQQDRIQPGPVTGYSPQAESATIPIGGGALSAPAVGLDVGFEAGTFSSAATVVHSPVMPLARPPLGILGAVGQAFSLVGIGSSQGERLTPALPFSLSLDYTNRSLGPVREDSLALYVWTGVSWEREPSSQLDAAQRRVTAQPQHFATWALLGETQTLLLPMLRR